MAIKKYTSSSEQRRAAIVLKPRVFMMFEAERMNKLRGTSEHGSEIITAYFNAKSEQEQKSLLESYDYHVRKNQINP